MEAKKISNLLEEIKKLKQFLKAETKRNQQVLKKVREDFKRDIHLTQKKLVDV